MDALLTKAQTLRCYLQSAAEQCGDHGDENLGRKLPNETENDVCYALDHTFLILPENSMAATFPKPPWSWDVCVSHSELIHHVIERLLARKRTASHWEDANILTLGYREVAPGASGHHVAQSNGIMCYYPNTLVSSFKKPVWDALHQLMGDDLMVHLLMNFTMFAQVKDAPLSYIQLAGKSLRHGLDLNAKSRDTQADSPIREVSINRVMYARTFQRDRVFAGSHVLIKASKTLKGCETISRAEASRVLQSIFPSTAGQKRLPKRLINLIPIVQSMVTRFKACDIEMLAAKLTPTPPAFRKFMADHPGIKETIAKRKAEVESLSRPLLFPIVRKAMEDGYLSQAEDVMPSTEHKRKRREEAVESRSNIASSSTMNLKAPSLKKQKHSTSTSVNHADSIGLAKLQEHKEEIKKLLEFSTPKKRVYRLVCKLLARVLPKDIWGKREAANWKKVKAMLRKLIFSRKFDIFSLKKCVEELQVTNVEWMNLGSKSSTCPPNERKKRHELFEDLLRWVIVSLVFPLLRNLYYITEAEGMANEIAYYQRPVWNVISTLALDDLDGGVLQLSSGQPSTNDEHQLATSRLRLLPKPTGVRPLMNLSAPVGQSSASVNRSLETVHRVLTFEMDRQPNKLLGSSVRNLDEIYRRLKPLFLKIASCPQCAERRQASGSRATTYIVTVDIERCFDTIRPRKLYQVLKKAMREDEYLIRKHWVGHQITSSNAARSPFLFKLERPAYPSGDLLSFEDVAAQSRKKNSMLVDGVIYDYLTKAKALKLLKEHLFANVVQMEGQEFVQRCGIPQGSVLSTTLCNIYYAHFERRVLRRHLPAIGDSSIVRPACCQHEELLRYTDDFLYITTDLTRAQRFLQVMHEGNQEYGCFVNLAKSQANFEPSFDQQDVQRIDAPEASGCVSWCGMLIDPATLQIYVNYDKLTGSLLQASIPLNETKAVQSFFVDKVISPIRQRWHALYFDRKLLSKDTVCSNIFQMLSVTAHRFIVLIEMLPFANRDMRFFHDCIHRILRKMTKSIHRSLELSREANDQPSGEDRSYGAQKDQVWTIGLYAFQLMLQVKRDQAQLTRNNSKVDWQTLLTAVLADRAEMKRAAKSQRRDPIQVELLAQDRRNSSITQRCLQPQ